MQNRIRAVRKEKKMTQEEFAKELGITRNYVNLIENGKETPSSRTISDMARVLEVNETWLRTGEGEMHEPMNRAKEIGELIASITKEDNIYIRALHKTLADLTEEEAYKLYMYAKKFVDNVEKETED